MALSEHKYPKNSAGARMVERVPVVSPTDDVAKIYKLLENNSRDLDTVNYVYVLNGSRNLVGIVSLRELFTAHKDTLVKDIMKKEVVMARPYTDQEKAAVLAVENNIKAVPVVDKDGKFLGVIDSDTVLSILHSENVEDFLRFAGVHTFDDPAKSIITASARTHIIKRLPWLLLGLAGGLLAMGVVSHFEELLEFEIVLAAFIPAVVYMADAVGGQTQTIFIRSLALDRSIKMRSYVVRESIIGIALAVILGLVVGVFAIVWWDSISLALIFGISMLMTILAAMIIAILMPWLLARLNYDPAIASGPFATVIRDILSLVIYLFVAFAFINYV